MIKMHNIHPCISYLVPTATNNGPDNQCGGYLALVLDFEQKYQHFRLPCVAEIQTGTPNEPDNNKFTGYQALGLHRIQIWSDIRQNSNKKMCLYLVFLAGYPVIRPTGYKKAGYPVQPQLVKTEFAVLQVFCIAGIL